MNGDCDCVCNHSGACTGCGICYVAAWWQTFRPGPVVVLPPGIASHVMRADPGREQGDSEDS